MAVKYLGVNVDQIDDPQSILVSSSPTGRAIEFSFEQTTTGISKLVLHNALAKLQHRLIGLNWPIP